MSNTNFLPKNQILISNYGNGIAVGIEGDATFIEKKVNFFFNYGAISKNGDFHFESNHFGYFLTTEEKLLNAVTTYYQTSMIASGEAKKRFKKNPKMFFDFCQEMAKTDIAKYKRENFMSFNVGKTYTFPIFQSEKSKLEEEEDFREAIIFKVMGHPVNIID